MGMMSESAFERVFRPAVVALMFGCLALSAVQLFHLLLPSWQGDYLAVMCALAALEANYSYRYLRRRSRLLYSFGRYRLIEFALLYFVLQATITIAEGHAAHLLGAVSLDTERVVSFGLMMFCWLGASDTARDLSNIGEPAVHDVHYRPPADHLVGRFFTGGAMLLGMTGISQLGLQAVTNLAHPPVSGLVLTVLVYFFLGTVMLGQIRYTALRHRWQREGIGVGAELSGRWIRYSLAFLGAVAALVFVLPTSYTVGLLDILRYTVAAVTSVLELLFFLAFWPIGWLLTLLGLHAPPTGAHHLHLPPSALSSKQASRGIDWVGLFRSIMFWAVVAGLLAYIVRGYGAGRLVPGRALAALQPALRLLQGWWAAVRKRLRRYASSVAEHVPRPGASALRQTVTAPRGGRPRFARMTPRERVLYYYLSVLRRAAGHGFPRRGAETPREYGQALTHDLPSAQGEMHALTQAFVEARYSRHEVPPAQESEARGNWQRVRAALQTLRRT